MGPGAGSGGKALAAQHEDLLALDPQDPSAKCLRNRHSGSQGLACWSANVAKTVSGSEKDPASKK